MLDELSKAIAQLLPPEAGKALRDNLDAAIRANAENLNLVTRERFEVQEKVLQRTRARVKELERQIADLEQRLQAAAGAGDKNPAPAE